MVELIVLIEEVMEMKTRRRGEKDTVKLKSNKWVREEMFDRGVGWSKSKDEGVWGCT